MRSNNRTVLFSECICDGWQGFKKSFTILCWVRIRFKYDIIFKTGFQTQEKLAQEPVIRFALRQKGTCYCTGFSIGFSGFKRSDGKFTFQVFYVYLETMSPMFTSMIYGPFQQERCLILVK